jgi:hypothetical protein
MAEGVLGQGKKEIGRDRVTRRVEVRVSVYVCIEVANKTKIEESIFFQ